MRKNLFLILSILYISISCRRINYLEGFYCNDSFEIIKIYQDSISFYNPIEDIHRFNNTTSNLILSSSNFSCFELVDRELIIYMKWISKDKITISCEDSCVSKSRFIGTYNIIPIEIFDWDSIIIDYLKPEVPRKMAINGSQDKFMNSLTSLDSEIRLILSGKCDYHLGKRSSMPVIKLTIYYKFKQIRNVYIKNFPYFLSDFKSFVFNDYPFSLE